VRPDARATGSTQGYHAGYAEKEETSEIDRLLRDKGITCLK
jgi:hypothetical protein